MALEVRNFLIKITIKVNETSQTKRLSKKIDLKIDWKEDDRGYLNPYWKKYITMDGKHEPKWDCWESRGEVIQFEENGKKYDILVKFTVKKGWFKDEVSIEGFCPASSESFFSVCGSVYDVNDREKYAIIPTQKRWKGYVLVSFFVIVGVVFVWLYKKMKD